MRKLITLWFLFITTVSFAQQPWEGGFGNAINRQSSPKGYNYRFNLGVGKGVLNIYSKERLDSLFGLRPLLPTGQRGQQFKVSTDNTNIYAPAEPLVYGQFIYNTAQLNRALTNGNALQLQIFNSFKRFAHGGSITDPSAQVINDTIPSVPSQTNSWSYDTVAHAIKSTFNSGPVIGFYSPESYANYVHSLTLTSTGNDNDRIGVVLAFYEDPVKKVKNKAYGLNPNDFNWPINVTDSLIPAQHSLMVIIGRENVNTQAYFVVYDYWKPTQKIIAQGSMLPGLQKPTSNWGGNEVDVNAVRLHDTITITRTQFSDASGGKGSLAFPLAIDLNSDTVLYKFKGSSTYGYAAQSQNLASYKNISFSGSNNVIYDLRNGNTYNFTGSGYVIDPAKNMYKDLGTRFFWRNSTERTFGYILPSGTYDVIVGSIP